VKEFAMWLNIFILYLLFIVNMFVFVFVTLKKYG